MLAETTIDSARNEEMRIRYIDPALILPWGDNPRKKFDKVELEELADSIKEVGLLEPLIVRPVDKYLDGYVLIAGERRWRAAKLAGLDQVPCVVRDVDDATALRLALVENLQRKDLDPLEEAAGYRQLREVCGLKEQQIAEAVHRAQSTISNRMRLLDLPDDVKDRIRKGELSPAHGVALARFKNYPAIASKVAEYAATEGWTSKQLEKRLPGNYGLERAGLVRSFSYGETQREQCQKCPHMRDSDNNWEKYCLDPACHDRLRGEEQRAQTEERQAKIAAALAAGDVVDLSNLSDYGDYVSLRYGAPACCTETCEYRKRGVDHRGDVADVCMRPTKHRACKARDTRDTKLATRESVEEARAKIGEACDKIAITSRELAVIAAYTLAKLSTDAITAGFAGCAEKPGTYNIARNLKVLSKMAPETIVRCTVRSVLEYEQLARLQDERYSNSHPYATMFYLGDDDASEAPTNQA